MGFLENLCQTSFIVNAAALSDVGRKRKENQDASGFHLGTRIFVVADGMGGYQGGEIASQLTIDTLLSEMSLPKPKVDNPCEHLKKTILFVNEQVHEESQTDPNLRGMGTTLTLLWIPEQSERQSKVLIGQVGDSRCYLYRKHLGLWPVTRDHSLIAEKIRAGIISRKDALSSPERNIITRSIGYEPQVQPDLYEMIIDFDCFFLLCSDGLHGKVSDEEIFQILEENLKQGLGLEHTLKVLIARANENGGEDNITALMVELKHETLEDKASQRS